jgi:riboflavin synthase
MFTGIIQAVGRVADSRALGGDCRLVIDVRDTPLPALAQGGSIAVNGACLTVVECDPGGFSADVSLETLGRTNLGRLGMGARVNLEPASRLGEALDGHLVTGHVDGLGTIMALAPAARSLAVSIEVPVDLARYIACKGSVAVDGVSLTVNAVNGARIEVNIVPYTLTHTRFGEYGPGSAVNIEVDLIARYVERLCRGGVADESHGRYSRS